MIQRATLSSALLHQLLTLVICLATAGITIAQTPLQPFLCGNDIFSSMVDHHYPDLRKAFQITFDNAKHATLSRGSEPLTVPVVVHVVWNDETENLHDSIIFNQLDILNNDFNRLNADTTELREVYRPVAASANIHFELVQIVRIHTDELFSVDLLAGNLLPEVKHTDLGGSDGWDPINYLNIWVCKIQPIEIFGIEVGQILGFSFPPNNLPHWPENVGAPTPEEDGVVVDFRVFGSNNPNSIDNPIDMTPLDVRGRTPVHEVGHYLGLRHIWGDGGTFGPNDCAQSDGIDDTPFANAQSNFDCDKSKNSCNVIEDYYSLDMPDLIENYMDYASEDCMNMFTQGQVDLMRNVLLGPRVALVTEPSAVSDIAWENEITVSPNPAKDEIQISFADPVDGFTSAQLISMDGAVLKNLALQSNGLNQYTTTVAGIAAGMYVVKVFTKEISYSSRLMIQ